jgi:hypothetical protein
MYQPPRKRPWITCLIVVAAIAVLSICCLAAIGGVGYYLYTSGQIDVNQLLSIAGMGPSEIQIINLSDGPIEAKLDRIDEETGEIYHKDDLDLAPYDIASYRNLFTSDYVLYINVPSELPPSSTCTLSIKGGQVYRVVTVPEGTVIARDRNKVDTIEELDISTTSLCQP